MGVLRCDWAEVASLVGVAVTPVVGFLGNISREQMHPNPDEVRSFIHSFVRLFVVHENRNLQQFTIFADWVYGNIPPPQNA